MTWLQEWQAGETDRIRQRLAEARAQHDLHGACQCCDFGNYMEECSCNDPVRQNDCGNTMRHLAPRHRLQHLVYLEEVLDLFGTSDIYDNELMMFTHQKGSDSRIILRSWRRFDRIQ